LDFYGLRTRLQWSKGAARGEPQDLTEIAEIRGRRGWSGEQTGEPEGTRGGGATKNENRHDQSHQPGGLSFLGAEAREGDLKDLPKPTSILGQRP